jgi:hypothetical protein
MSTLPALTMEDLELEHAELLPRRETLTLSWKPPSVNVTQIVGNGNGNGNGSHDGNGNVGFFNVGNGSGDGNLSGDGNGDGNLTIG